MDGSSLSSSLKGNAADGFLNGFLSGNGITEPVFTRIKAGRNSRVWRVDSPKGRWVLKEYHRHPDDTRDRLGTEYRFLSFLAANGIRNIPEPVAFDSEHLWGLYSFLPGEPVRGVTKVHVNQAVSFIYKINKLREHPDAGALPDASEACFSLKEHLHRLSGRLESLERISGYGVEFEQAKTLVDESLIPAFKRVCRIVLEEYDQHEMESVLSGHERFLSPSDLGFHNALDLGGILCFLDFEYAGWDDPAKLLCDFACQPEVPVDAACADAFWEQVCHDFNLGGALKRARLLLPVYRLKWCCILLNEFRRADRDRRLYSGRDTEGLLSLQVKKAEEYFDRYMGEK